MCSYSAEADKEMFSQFNQTVEMIWNPQATGAYQMHGGKLDFLYSG